MNTITLTQPNGTEVDVRVDAIVAVSDARYPDKSKEPVVDRDGASVRTLPETFVTKSTRQQVLDAIGAESTVVPFGKKKGRRAKKDDEGGDDAAS